MQPLARYQLVPDLELTNTLETQYGPACLPVYLIKAMKLAMQHTTKQKPQTQMQLLGLSTALDMKWT